MRKKDYFKIGDVVTWNPLYGGFKLKTLCRKFIITSCREKRPSQSGVVYTICKFHSKEVISRKDLKKGHVQFDNNPNSENNPNRVLEFDHDWFVKYSKLPQKNEQSSMSF